MTDQEKSENASLDDICFRFFSYAIDRPPEVFHILRRLEVKHLLDLYRTSFIPMDLETKSRDLPAGRTSRTGHLPSHVQRVRDHEGILEINHYSGKSISELKSPGNDGSNENNANGEVGYEFNEANKGEATLHRRSRSPAKRKNKNKGLSCAETARSDRSNRLSQSPSNGRYHDEDSHRSKSKSPSYIKRKSHSQSTIVEEYLRQGQAHVCDLYDKGEYMLVKDRNRERRHVKEEIDQGVHELWDRERKENCRDSKMEKETKIRDRDHEEERRHHGRDRDQESSRFRETNKEREDNKKGKKWRGRSRDAINDGEYDEVRYREKDNRSSKARDLPQRGSSPSSYMNRDLDREWGMNRERYRDGSRDVHERQRDK